MKISLKKILSFLFVFIIFSIPVVSVYAALPVNLASDCGKVEKGVIANPCDFNDFMALINKAITFLLFVIATPLAALAVCYSGFLFMTSGDSPEKRNQAKSILTHVIVGYVLALAAWLIVNTIMKSLGYTGTTFLQSY